MQGNGCPECEKLPDGKLCDMCDLALRERCVDVAFSQYVEKVNDILKKKEIEDERRRPETVEVSETERS